MLCGIVNHAIEVLELSSAYTTHIHIHVNWAKLLEWFSIKMQFDEGKYFYWMTNRVHGKYVYRAQAFEGNGTLYIIFSLE